MTNQPTLNNKFFNIGSLYQWALASFFVVTIPLVVAIIFTVIEVTKYTQRSQQTLFQSVNSTENSRIILERLIAMERSIRQFQVLNETELFDTYLEHRIKFLFFLESQKSSVLDKKLLKKLNILYQNENKLYHGILSKSKDIQLTLTATDLDAFDPLTTQARSLLSEGEKRVGKEASTLSAIAKRVRKRLLYSAIASIPLAIILGFIFVHLLTRPIKEIAQAIRNLGEVGFEQEITIKGPKDLKAIGHQLEWLREKLNRLEYEKQQFIRNVSHELKTPLTTLKEGTDLLSENVVGELNTEQQEIIQLMKLGIITLHDLVENLLEYQKTISTQIDLNLSTFELKTLITRIINEYQLPIRSKKIALINNISPAEIRADYDKLKIIISNVFSNALKFSPQNGIIGLSLSVNFDSIQIIIEDQGRGVDKDILNLIFDDFYLGSTPQDWKIKGSGLGLALVKHYLKVHEGSIRLLPPNKNFCGARFSLLIPKNLDA